MKEFISPQSLVKSSLVSFLIMFVLTYSAIDTFDHFFLNINKLYMAAVMTSPMLIVKAVSMKKMIQQQHFKFLMGVGTTLTIIFFLAIRSQFMVDDGQFLRSMIPHHSSAIVMCEDSDIKDADIIELCDQIVETQKREIELMQRMLQEKNL